MAEVAGHPVRTEKDTPVNNGRATQPGSHSDNEGGMRAGTRPVGCFPEGVAVHVIEDAHRQAAAFGKMRAEGLTAPAGHGVRGGGNAPGLHGVPAALAAAIWRSAKSAISASTRAPPRRASVGILASREMRGASPPGAVAAKVTTAPAILVPPISSPSSENSEPGWNGATFMSAP